MAQVMDSQEMPEEVETLDELDLDPGELERIARIDFSVDRDDELPVGLQLEWKIRAMVAGGVLRPDDRVPSVRELADFCEVNVNTARAVYRKLEARGLLASEHGRGTFVAAGAGSAPGVEQVAAEAIDWARASGVDPREVAVAIFAAAGARGGGELTPPGLPDPTHELDERGLRRELRAQIARLEAELGGHAWEDRREPRDRPREPAAHVASVAELERTREALAERLAKARRAAEQRGERESRARVRVEEMVRDPDAHRWQKVLSEEAGEPDCKHWHVVPRFGPLGAIAGWWRVKVSSGCPLAGPLRRRRPQSRDSERTTRASGGPRSS